MTAIKPCFVERTEAIAAKIMQFNHNQIKHNKTRSKNHTKWGQSPIRCLLLLPMLGSGALLSPPLTAQAQSRTTTASQERVLRQRLSKAVNTYNGAAQIVAQYPLFQVFDEIVDGDESELRIYGRAIGAQNAPANAMGWATDERFLTIRNYSRGDVHTDRFQGYYVAIAQTVYAPPPAHYLNAVATMNKYAEIATAIQGELSTLLAKQKQNELKAAQARYAREDAVDKVRRDSVHRSRVALQQKEAKATLAKIDGELAGSSNKLVTLRSGRERLIALFNKWGELGVPDRALYDCALQMSLQLATLEARVGRMEPAMREVAMLLSLDIFGSNHADETTERQLFSIGNDEDAPFPVKRTLLTLRSGQTGQVLQESATVKSLADAWFEQLPLYMAKKPSPSKETSQGLAAISQVLATRLFRMDAKRTLALAQALNRAQVLYGVPAVPVLPQFRNEVTRINLRSNGMSN